MTALNAMPVSFAEDKHFCNARHDHRPLAVADRCAGPDGTILLGAIPEDEYMADAVGQKVANNAYVDLLDC